MKQFFESWISLFCVPNVAAGTFLANTGNTRASYTWSTLWIAVSLRCEGMNVICICRSAIVSTQSTFGRTALLQTNVFCHYCYAFFLNAGPLFHLPLQGLLPLRYRLYESNIVWPSIKSLPSCLRCGDLEFFCQAQKFPSMFLFIW